MERRFEARLDEMMGQAEVSPELLKDLLPRAESICWAICGEPSEPEQKQHTVEYMTGLVSGLECKTARGSRTCTIKTDRESRSSLVMCRGNISRLLATLASQVGQELGEADGVIVFDPSAFPKKRDQVGGRRQAVVRPVGQSRELPGRGLHGLRDRI